MGSPSASPNLGSSPGSGSPSIDTFKRRSLHYTDSFSAAASSTGQRPWMRFFQQRRTQRENQINHKIDEKQKQLAELHSQPECATASLSLTYATASLSLTLRRRIPNPHPTPPHP